MMLRNLTLIALISIANIAYSEVNVSKDWVWEVTQDDFIYAATLNSEKRMLGQYCYLDEGSCYYLVSLGITCEQGSEYPSILNSDAGVSDVRLVCGHKYNDENVFFIKPFDEADRIVLSASEVGFAVAMEGGSFKVVRFSLSGSTHAIEMLSAATEYLYNKKDKKVKVKSEEYL